MPRQYTQRTPEEKYGIVQDYFSSGLPLTKYRTVLYFRA